MAGETPDWLHEAVSKFGATCHKKLAGPGEPEAAIRAPLEALMSTVGAHLGVPAVFHDEVTDSARRVRPDYGVTVKGAITGYVEVKAPGHTINPAQMPANSHDRKQWERQRDLPNLVYTNGTDWRLYRDGELYRVASLTGELNRSLQASPYFEALITDFLRWAPAPITSVDALVRTVAPLTRLLRGEVLDQLELEQRAVSAGADEDSQPFTGLARDWRSLLFPQATASEFADGYAQAVTFALLLARTTDIDLARTPLHQIGVELGSGHTLMGKALQLLTDDVAADFKVTLDLLVRVIGAVSWPRVREGRHDMYLHLYEHFLTEYDPELRRASGSYYTPREVVEHMVRLAEEALVTKLDRPTGFRDPDVLTIDPAMGTGTFLHTILDRVAIAAEAADGWGSVPGAVERAAERIVGFELQMGPFAVAELRTSDLLTYYKASAPPSGMKLYVTDTLDDPHTDLTQIPSTLRLIAQSRRRANDIKRRANVTVVIGNPPYREIAVGDGGWVESGGLDLHDRRGRTPAILDDFLKGIPGRFSVKLKNLYIYFWRWATWKVWESTTTEPNGASGIVCYISTSGYLTGPAFTSMREYLRRHASEGWIINVTPEGQTPHVPTRIFPGVRQPLAIGLFVRTPETDTDVPATIHYRTVTGSQASKFAQLAQISLGDDGWRDARTQWTAPLTAAASTSWDMYPALSALLPWYSPGMLPTRTWVYAPDSATLQRRWHTLMSEPNPQQQDELFKVGPSTDMDRGKPPLPGAGVHETTLVPLRQDRSTSPVPVRVAYRAFDRQWVLPDSRMIHRTSANLWAARQSDQVFVVEQHAHAISSGPALVFAALVPDYDYFKGSEGGRTLPLLHPGGSANLAPGLIEALTQVEGVTVQPRHVLAYIAAVVSHPGFTQTFADELTTPGIRVPITCDSELWQRAVELGERVVWLHTYGAAFSGEGRPADDIRMSAPERPLSTQPIQTHPDEISYDDQRGAIRMGDGEFAPVSPAVWNYAVGGRNVIKSWFNYRKNNPGGRRASPLDEIYAQRWLPEWTTEFVDLLSVLTQLVELEPAQAELLADILEGEIFGMEAMAAAGVRWPASDADRRPRHSLTSATSAPDQPTLL